MSAWTNFGTRRAGGEPVHPWRYALARRLLREPHRPAITAADPNREEADLSPVMGERGVTGLDVRWGVVFKEYSSRLQSLSDRMTAYEEMRRSDSALAAMEAIITLPIMHADWRVDPGDDPELADLIAQNLFTGLTHPFMDFLRVCILAVLYGFSIHEKVFEEKEDGFLGWRKFADRERQTVYKWIFDSTGGLAGFTQYGRNPQTGNYVYVDIPVKKLLVSTWRRESNDPEGLGAFRQAYKHWFFKQTFEEFAAIRIERQAGGMMKAEGPPEGYTKTEGDAMLVQLKRMRTAEDASMIHPPGWQVEMLSLGPADVPFETHIERQHQSMLQCVLGQFVGLAQGGDSGAWALSRDSSSFFLMSLEGVADWFTENMNRYCIPQLCRYNKAAMKKYPQLAHGPIGVRDMDALARTLWRMYQKDHPLPGEIETYMRDAMGLPPAPPGGLAADQPPEEEPPTEESPPKQVPPTGEESTNDNNTE